MSIAARRPTRTIAAASWMWAAVSPTSMRAAVARPWLPKADQLVQCRCEGAGGHSLKEWAGPFLLRFFPHRMIRRCTATSCQGLRRLAGLRHGPDNPVRDHRRRRAVRLCARRQWSTAAQDRELAQPPRVRLAQPGVE